MLDKKFTKERFLSFIDKVTFFFFAVLMFFLPISNAVIESCFGFIFLCVILKISLKDVRFEDIKFFKNKINTLLLLFYLFIGLSIFMSGPLLIKSLKAWFFKWGEGVLLFYFAQLLLKKRDIKFLLVFFFISTLLECIYGLFQAKFDLAKGLSMALLDILSKEIHASFNHYNDFATFLTVMFFIILGALYETRKFWFKVILGFLGFLVTVNIIFTGSRGAWLSFLVVIFSLGFILYNNRKKQNNLIYMYIIISLFILAVFWITPLTDRLFSSFQVGGDSHRFEIWRISFSIFKKSPLVGTGIGLFMDRLPVLEIGPQYAHNCYLQILVETGIVGLLSFLLFLGTIITQGLVKIIRDFDELFLGLFSAFIAFLIHSFFDTQLYSLKLSILFWLLASFITVYLTEPEKHSALSSLD